MQLLFILVQILKILKHKIIYTVQMQTFPAIYQHKFSTFF